MRNESEVQLLRYDLSPSECSAFQKAMKDTLYSLLLPLQEKTVRVERCVPDTADLLPVIQIGIVAIVNNEEWLSPEIRRRIV